MPIENRLDMELTGIKTSVGVKIQGPNLDQIQHLGARVQQILAGLPEMRSAFAERVAQGFYLNVEVNRAEAARHGLTVGDVQRAVTPMRSFPIQLRCSFVSPDRAAVVIALVWRNIKGIF